MLRQTKKPGQEPDSMAALPRHGEQAVVAPYQSHAICVVCERSCFRNIAHRFRSSSSFFLWASFRLPRKRQDPTGISWLSFGMECVLTLSTRRQLRRFGGSLAKESRFEIIIPF